MYYVYVLIDSLGNFYTGYTDNLRRRLKEHQAGLVYATKFKLPVNLVYYEGCKNKYDAIKREKFLKSGPGKKYLRNRLKNYLKASGPLNLPRAS